MIEISAEAVERVQKLLESVPKGAEKALSSAINRGLSRVKTGASKRVKEVYTVQGRAFNEATKIRVNKADTGNLVGFVSFSGYKIPLYKFQVTPKAPGTRQQVRAAIMKGGGTPFENAFIAQMKSGHVGVFERKTQKRFPVEEIMGLSAAQMIGNENIIAGLEAEAQEIVNERLEHEIDRLLNGYGG